MKYTQGTPMGVRNLPQCGNDAQCGKTIYFPLYKIMDQIRSYNNNGTRINASSGFKFSPATIKPRLM